MLIIGDKPPPTYVRVAVVDKNRKPIPGAFYEFERPEVEPTPVKPLRRTRRFLKRLAKQTVDYRATPERPYSLLMYHMFWARAEHIRQLGRSKAAEKRTGRKRSPRKVGS